MKAYIYQADLICEGCANDKKEDLQAEPLDTQGDPLHWPQGPYPDGGGEADSPQHCGTCGLFLENPLTEDGELYVLEAHNDSFEIAKGNYKHYKNHHEVINAWTEFYDYLDLAPLTSEEL